MKTDATYDPAYVYKKVASDELEWSTAEGWELVDSFDENTQRFEWNDVPLNSESGRYGGCRREPVLGAALTTRFFLVRRKRGEVRTIENLRQEVSEQRSATSSLQDMLDTAKKELEDAQRELATRSTQLGDEQNSLRELRRTKNRLESDLAKVRKAIGTQQWDAIFNKKKDDDE